MAELSTLHELHTKVLHEENCTLKHRVASVDELRKTVVVCAPSFIFVFLLPGTSWVF
jgi:hypothetical protein